MHQVRSLPLCFGAQRLASRGRAPCRSPCHQSLSPKDESLERASRPSAVLLLLLRACFSPLSSSFYLSLSCFCARRLASRLEMRASGTEARAEGRLSHLRTALDVLKSIVDKGPALISPLRTLVKGCRVTTRIAVAAACQFLAPLLSSSPPVLVHCTLPSNCRCGCCRRQ
jgi:hypothetical protein